MKQVESRLYGYDPVYDRLDRKELFEYAKKVLGIIDREELGLYSRRELIDLILDAETEARQNTFDDPEEYPLRRLEEKWGPATTLTRKKGQSLYWCWEEDPLSSAKSLVTSVTNYDWNLVEGIREGDLVLTVVDSTPPLIVVFEVTDSVHDGKIYVDRLATFSNPISLLEIEERLESTLPRMSQKLDAATADKVLTIISDLVDNPRPIFITAGKCMADDDYAAHETLAVISLLQQGEVEEISCDACGRIDPSSLEPHLFRPKMENVRLEVQDHVDDMALLCLDCHKLAHRPSLQDLREFAAAPACPDCGERNPQSFIWGMPAGPPSENQVIAGCDIPSGILPEWLCRECETSYTVVAYRDGFGLARIDSQNNPVYV